MRTNPERSVLFVTIVLSLVLTALTVWAVAQQSRTLQQRDLDTLRRGAEQTAARVLDGWKHDASQTFESAGYAYAAGPTGLNYWAATQTRWPLIFYRSSNAAWERLPRPGTPALPSVGSAKPAAPTAEEQAAYDALRSVADEVSRELPPAPAPSSGTLREPSFLPLSKLAAVVVHRRMGEHAELALVTPIAPLWSQYADPSGEVGWEIGFERDPHGGRVLAGLGPAFADSHLYATAATEARLSAEGKRRWRYVLVTACGGAFGWGLLLWLMVRLMRGQREVVRLQKRIIADVSHELKTPLALIRLHAETLREGRVRDPQRRQEYLDTITRESERLTVLLDSILDFSRFERGRREYDFHECDLVVVARQAWSLYQPQLAEAGFDARCEFPDGPLRVFADAHALQQVMVNLLQNAFRYSRDRKFIRLRVRSEGHIAIAEVEDQGIGMSREQLRELGASFVRGADPQVRQTRGTGLGLAIVHHIVAAHHGKIEVNSRPGEGSTFTVWLPIEDGGLSRTL